MDCNAEANRATARSDLIHLLEFEIKSVQEEDKKPGWTVWALTGSIASIIWLILKEIEGFPLLISPPQVLLLLLGCWFLWGFMKAIPSLLAPWSKIARIRPRFWYSDALLGTDRLHMFAVSIWEIGLFFSLFLYPIIQQQLTIWLIRLELGFGVLGAIGALVLSYVPFPLSHFIGGRKILPSAAVIKCLVAGACTTGIIYAVGVQRPQINIHELRVALLISVGVLLFLHLLELRSPNPLLNTLIDLRRKLGLSQIEEPFARREAEIAFNGMNASDLFREQLDSILTKRRQVVVLQKEILSALDAFTKLIPDGAKLSDEHKTLLKSLFESTGSKFDKATQLTAEISADSENFGKRIESMIQWFPLAGTDLKKSFKSMRNQMEELTPEILNTGAEIKKRLDRLRRHMDV